MKRGLTILGLLTLASVSPLIFPIAESGRSSLDVLAKLALLPAIGLLLLTLSVLYRVDDSLARISTVGLAAGAVATLALEAIRLPGFWLGFMPGNLPRLMCVLLLNQFGSGPSLRSDIAGWAYHFWNGASFGLIYLLVFGTCRRWVAAVFGVLVGAGFIFSPVVSALARSRLSGAGVFERVSLDGHGCPRCFRSRAGVARSDVARLCSQPAASGLPVSSKMPHGPAGVRLTLENRL